MNNTIFMNVLNTSNDLLHKFDSLGLIETFSFDNIIEQLSSFSILHDEMYVSFSLDNLIELYNVGMS